MIGRLTVFLLLCAALSLPVQATSGTEADTPSGAPQTAPKAGAATEGHTEPVIIESQPLEPTREEMARRFREKLTAPPSVLESERRLDAGVVEVTTPAGRFCYRPSPDQLQSNLGGSVTLFAPCTSF